MPPEYDTRPADNAASETAKPAKRRLPRPRKSKKIERVPYGMGQFNTKTLGFQPFG
jgi:hypothetical protein